MRTNILLVILCLSSSLWGQDPWKIIATDIRPDHYYGVTVGNGMLGIVSSAYPFRTDNVVLAGSYDKYGRGRVSNFLNGFNMLNTSVSIDGKTVNCSNISGFTQTLDMKMPCTPHISLWRESRCHLLLLGIEAIALLCLIGSGCKSKE